MSTDDQVTIDQLSRELREVAKENRDVAKEMHAIRRIGVLVLAIGTIFAGFFISGAVYIATSVIQHDLQIASMQGDLESHQNSATPHPVQLLSQERLVNELSLIKQELTYVKSELTSLKSAQTTRR